MKVCYFDVETTGLSPVHNDIIEIACIIEIDGEVKEEFELKMQPFNFDFIDLNALKSCNTTVEELKTQMLPNFAYQHLIKTFGMYIDKFNKNDKFTPAGYNVKFDVDFLLNFFKKNNDVYYGSWFNWHMLDPLPLLHWMKYSNVITLSKFELGEVCKYLKIDLGEAHVALNDVRATRKVMKCIQSIVFD